MHSLSVVMMPMVSISYSMPVMMMTFTRGIAGSPACAERRSAMSHIPDGNCSSNGAGAGPDGVTVIS